MKTYIQLNDEEIEEIKNGKPIEIKNYKVEVEIIVIHEKDFERVRKGELDVDMCIDCNNAEYSNQGRPYCMKEERHLDSFSYKPDWCPLKAGGIDD